ncbi:MAG TPA: class I poly(R)-hydroxyalkanoic acid synthase [Candidatus Thiothrix moscowensis]|uniref:PHA/PHB synthase family protein n=1 Tax=unclassified Thiothrix TaxID=2636184 RepID=UPI0025EF70D1|nr:MULTISPECIES: class I poly(R)-hydroxyalkanoic acid synthase [unclassified Thiothrix]HRJ51803.1 class I poly(R)-hydroxyalkanoic acid synthase [Candidatus Thiothrix moscowensis]HRJ92118.1 class I poly(R)-hydroxyalkanoic acid synthase [Candidatus Thiothrix moscowensis]
MSDNTQPGDSQAAINTLGFASVAKEMGENFKQVEEIMAGFSKSYESLKLDPFNLKQAYSDWMEAIAKNPEKLIEANMAFWQKSMELTQHAMQSFLTGQPAGKVIEAPKSDRRFSHEDWETKPIFDVIKQSYLLVSDWTRKVVASAEGLDAHTAERVKFFTERNLDAMSPTNFALTNPAVIEKIRNTKGANLVHGLKNMLEDLEAGNGQLRIRMTDTKAFKLGENVAATPGKVVFQNRMFQLIQYTPSTEKVLKRPLLIVPPWINKFYIMDLQPKNSMLKWLVDQGHTVFVISWINPDETYAEVGFEDYVHAVVQAMDAVQYDTGEAEMNAIGYCIGGTLLTSTLAYLKAKGDNRIKSATFFTTMLNFAEPGELGLFIDEVQISGLEAQMNEQGYMDGSLMAGAFNLLRANDLIWSFYVNNYLMGNDPRPFDLLYWNSDSTRMPAKMHSWYLRNLYKDNKLCQPKALSIDGVELDIGTIDTPACFISAIEDHIAPWKSTYSGARLFGGDVRFILGGSGHIAGIINPPAAKKYNYRVSDDLPESADTWLANTQVNAGSWWPEWDGWVRTLGDAQVDARQPGMGKLKAIEDAPGTYVKCRLGEPAPRLEVTQLPEVVAAPEPVAAAEPEAVAAPEPVAAAEPEAVAAPESVAAAEPEAVAAPAPKKAAAKKSAKPKKPTA